MESSVIPVSFQTLPAMGSNISKVEALLTEEICQFEESGGGSKGNNRNSKSSEESSSKRQSTSIKRQKCPPSSRRLSNKEDQRDGTSSTTTTATNVTTESDSTASSSKSQRKARRKEKIKVVVLTSGSASSASSSKHNKSLDAVLATSSGSSDHQSLSSLDRSNLDVVRDKKRILEVCYGTTTTTTGNKNSEMAGNDGIEVSIKPLPTTDKEAKDSSIEKEKRKNKKQKKDKKTKKKKKTFKKVEKGETKQTETIHQSKKKGAVPLEDKENIDRNSDSIGNPQDATETKEKMKLPVEKRKKVAPKGTTTAATATTKKKKVRVVNRRDAAGRVVRKRLKGTGRDKVVRKECFRKGKDAKIGLATISEDFYDGLVGTDSDDDCDDDDEEYECSSSSSDEDDDGDGDGDAFSSDLDGDNDRNETNEESSANEVSSTTADRRLRSASSSNPPSDVRNNSNRTIPSNEDNPIPTEPARIVDTISDTDNDNEGRENSLGESASSVDSTACTSTATAENAREEKSVLCCFGSFRIMICTGVLFVVAVAAATIMVGYVFVFRKDIPTVSPTLAPSIAPNVGQRPNLRPSLAQLDTFQPSSPIAATPAPSTSIFNTLSTSCYLPDDKPGAETAEAEYAPELFGFATISNWNGGYCGEGYVTILMIAGSGFRFSSFEVDQTGYYKVALRYNNADKAKKSLGLRIDDRDEGAFDLVSTGNETSWLVDDIDNILLSKGKHAIRVSVEETDDTTGPNVDWLTLVLQEPLSRFDYLSGLVAQANGMTAQTLSQTRTLQWMANEDSIDYSTLTSQEVIERYALIQIYHSAAGDTWIDNTQWLSELHACGWYGITCSKKDNINLVTDLMLDSNGLIGYLPTDLALLTNIILISMHNNDLQGTIPTQIGKLINLSTLFFGTNFLDGALPSELGSLEKLQTIDLRFNFLYGKIPEEFYSMVRLEKLALGSNYLTGTLSTSIGQLKALKDLDLQISQLSGTIPTELGELTMLTSLTLGLNLFTGQIPGELGLLKNLNLLDIHSNQLNGILPPELSLLKDTTINYNGNDVVIGV